MVKKYLVTWTDSRSHPEWTDDTRTMLKGGNIISSLGWLVDEDDLHILLSQSKGHQYVHHTLKIPRSAIQSMTLLSVILPIMILGGMAVGFYSKVYAIDTNQYIDNNYNGVDIINN